MDSATVDTVTREAWEEAGFKTNSRRLPSYMGRSFLNRFPKTVKAGYPHQTEGFNVLQRFKRKPVLLKLFFPVRKLHLGHEAGQVIMQARLLRNFNGPRKQAPDQA